MRKLSILLIATTFLSGCVDSLPQMHKPDAPANWIALRASEVEQVEVEGLKGWWTRFNDPVLNQLVTFALDESPDRNMARAKIMEARGIRRSSLSSLFPQIGASSGAKRENTVATDTINYYDAGFDASFEIDLFGKNRNNFKAADANVDTAEADYHSVTLSLIAEVARAYINYRAGQKQVEIAQKNLHTQEKTLELITRLKNMGEAPQLDVERAQTLVSTTRASIPEFQRQADIARLSLTVLTGKMPEQIMPIISSPGEIPGSDVKPALMAPAKVLSLRPDVKSAQANLSAQTFSEHAAFAELFPALSISSFYGLGDTSLISSQTIWNIAGNAAIALLDFGRIEGKIDAARAREVQAFELYRKTVYGAVVDVETALSEYGRFTEKRNLLQKAYESADRSLTLSNQLFQEGEISFLDVLDAQRQLNEADFALTTAQEAQAQSLIRLYKSLSVY